MPDLDNTMNVLARDLAELLIRYTPYSVEIGPEELVRKQIAGYEPLRALVAKAIENQQ